MFFIKTCISIKVFIKNKVSYTENIMPTERRITTYLATKA